MPTYALNKACLKLLMCRRGLGNFLFLFLNVQFLMGCIGISHLHYSKPVVDKGENIAIKFEKYVGDLFVTSDIGFNIEPLNKRGVHFPIFPLPLPIPSKDPPFTKPPFTVSIALKPLKSSAIFHPQDVYFWIPSSIKYTPTNILGPFDCSSPILLSNKKILPDTEFAIREGVASCMFLEFDVPPPDPSQTFFIEIAGVKIDGIKQLLPTIQFKEDKQLELFSLP